MIKRVFAVASLAAVVATIGCGASPDSSDSTASDQALAQGAKATGTLSLTDAKAKIDAIRATFDPTGDNALILDTSLAPAYLKAIAPVFAQTAPKDTLALGLEAFQYTSYEIVTGGLFDNGLLDDAIASSFDDVWTYSFMYGDAASDNPEFWTKLNGLLANSSLGSLSDLQLFTLVTSTKSSAMTWSEIATGLRALDWVSARPATAADVKTISDGESPFSTFNVAIFGDGQTAATSHDIDESDTLAVEVFKRSYAEIRLLAPDDGEVAEDLGESLNAIFNYTGKPAASGLALAKSVLTASEMKIVDNNE